MKIIDRYLGITAIRGTMLVLLMLMGLSVFISLVKEIGDIGTGDYGILAVLEYIALDLPQQIYAFFPMACLLGTLLGLGALASNSELIILRASGVSVGRIIWIVIKATLLMLVVATLIGEGLGPMAQHTAEVHKALLTSSGQALKTNQGTWIRDGENFLYIHTIVDNKDLRGISRYQFDNQHNLLNASYAATGAYIHGHWIMQNVVESNINSTKVTITKMPQADWQLSLSPNLLRISVVDPEEMSLLQLNSYLSYLKKNNLNATNYLLSFWQRLLQPLATIIMVWLAIPFIFGPLRSSTMGLRVLLGATFGFCFITLNQFFGPLSTVYQFPPILAASCPLFLFALTAWILQRRVR